MGGVCEDRGMPSRAPAAQVLGLTLLGAPSPSLSSGKRDTVPATSLVAWAWGLWASPDLLPRGLGPEVRPCRGPIFSSPVNGRPREPLGGQSQVPQGPWELSAPCWRCLRKHQFTSIRKIFFPKYMALC